MVCNAEELSELMGGEVPRGPIVHERDIQKVPYKIKPFSEPELKRLLPHRAAVFEQSASLRIADGTDSLYDFNCFDY